MTAFTVLGVLTYVALCFGAGCTLGLWLDLRRGVDALLAPIEREAREVRALVARIVRQGKKGRSA